MCSFVGKLIIRCFALCDRSSWSFVIFVGIDALCTLLNFFHGECEIASALSLIFVLV